MKQVYSARNEVDAQLVKGFLDERAIQSVVQGAGYQNILGSIPMTPGTSPGIWVREEDLGRALDAIAGFKTDAVPARPVADPWTCSKCGEQVERQVTEGWSCRAGKPAAQ